MSRNTSRQGQSQGQRKAGEVHDVTAGRLRHDELRYEGSGKNPIFAWSAVAECLSAGVDFPDWVQDYLGTVASKIMRMSRQSAPRKNQVARAVAAAVGLECRGRYNPFDELGRPGHELMIAMNVYQCHTDNWWKQRKGLEPTHKWRAVFEAGAERHNQTCRCGRRISWKTAERYFRKHARVVIPPHLLEQSKSQKLSDILR